MPGEAVTSVDGYAKVNGLVPLLHTHYPQNCSVNPPSNRPARFMLATPLGLLALLAFAGPGTGGADDGFTALVKGTDPAQFEVVGLDRASLTIKDGEVRLAGKPEGYFATRESYKNYLLQFEWLYEKHHGKASDGNSGLLVHISGPARVWPRAVEVQIWYKDFGSFYTHGGGKFNPRKDDRAARDKVLKPPGEWNLQEVECKDGRITLRVNGVEYARGDGADPREGRIGWMAEGSPIRFRNLRI